VWDFLEEHRVDYSRPLVLLHPATRWKTKTWEERNWVILADMLHEAYGATIVVTGSPADKTLINGIVSATETEAINSAGVFNLNELAFLQMQASVLVTPDSGPMHLAAAVGTPVVALFGPTDPSLTGPYGDGHTIISREMDCRPCLKRQCTTKVCMAQITPREVCEAVHHYLPHSQQQRSKTT
jgi:ADP-heptose:LPS heptosyltransferase